MVIHQIIQIATLSPLQLLIVDLIQVAIWNAEVTDHLVAVAMINHLVAAAMINHHAAAAMINHLVAAAMINHHAAAAMINHLVAVIQVVTQILVYIMTH